MRTACTSETLGLQSILVELGRCLVGASAPSSAPLSFSVYANISARWCHGAMVAVRARRRQCADYPLSTQWVDGHSRQHSTTAGSARQRRRLEETGIEAFLICNRQATATRRKDNDKQTSK